MFLTIIAALDPRSLLLLKLISKNRRVSIIFYYLINRGLIKFLWEYSLGSLSILSGNRSSKSLIIELDSLRILFWDRKFLFSYFVIGLSKFTLFSKYLPSKSLLISANLKDDPFAIVCAVSPLKNRL